MNQEQLAAAWVDSRCAPLYVWRIPRSPDTTELKAALSAIQTWVKTLDAPYGWITDPRALEVEVIAQQRSLLAEHLRIVAPKSELYCAGMSMLITNPVLRGVATAVGWMTPYSFPTAFHGSYAEADLWVRQQLQLRGAVLVPRAPG